MSSDIPLKLKNNDGDLQKFTSSEENYLAYQLGLRLAGVPVDNAGALTTYASYGGPLSLVDFETVATTIGTFTDTFYQEIVEPIGGGTTLGLGSTQTKLYQFVGTDDPIEVVKDYGAGYYQRAVRWDSDGSINEMTSAESMTLATRLLSTVMTNEYPGTYRIASSAPSADHAATINSLYTDTRNDGTSITYNLYRKNSGTSPTKTNSVSVKYDNGSFDGLNVMTEQQMQYSFGSIAQKIQQTAGNIGTYQLRSSAQGAPTDPGTWVSRGTVTDTRNPDSDTDFITGYARDYLTDYEKTIDYTGQFSTPFVGQYNRDTDETYVGDFIGYITNPTTIQSSYVTVQPTQYAGTRPAQYAGVDPTQYAGTDPCVFSDPTTFFTSDPCTFGQPTFYPGVAPTNFTDPTVFYGTFVEYYPGSDPTSYPGFAPTNFSTFVTGPKGQDTPTFYPGTAPTTFATTAPTNFVACFDFTAFGANYYDTFAATNFLSSDACTFNQPTSIPGADPCTFIQPTQYARVEATQYAGIAPTLDPGSDPSSYVGPDATSYTGAATYSRPFVGTYVTQVDETYVAQFSNQFAGPELTKAGDPVTYEKAYEKVYSKAYTGTAVTEFIRQIETYTLYVRIS